MIRQLQAKDCVQLFNGIFHRVMRQLQLRQVGRHYYDPVHPINIPQHKLELWPGYITSIHPYEDKLLLMLDVSHKLLRTDSALDFLYDMYHQQFQNFQEQVTKQPVGMIVLTRYNNKTYRVDDIEWNMNPESTFTSSQTGEWITFRGVLQEAVPNTDRGQATTTAHSQNEARTHSSPAGPVSWRSSGAHNLSGARTLLHDGSHRRGQI